MSEALNNSHDQSKNGSGGGNEPLEYAFDPSSSGAPSLRQPNLGKSDLNAAIQYEFSGTYLPSHVTGGGGGAGSNSGSGMERNNSRQHQQQQQHPASNNQSNLSNSNSNHNHHQHVMAGQQSQSSPLFVDNYNHGLTPEQMEGLLGPLPHPDLNQLPPDVLAILLKSSRFDLIIPTQRAQQQQQQQQQINHSEGANSHGAGPSSSYTNNNSASTPPRSQQSSEINKTYLSPLAKEFVPTTFQSSPMNSQQEKETANLAYAMSQVQFQEQQDSFQSLDDFEEGPDCILSTITDMISQVSQDPASLNRCTKASVEVLKKYLNDEDTLGIVVTLLTEQMISNDNFCYSGAKILEAFRKNQIGTDAKGNKGIKPLLLNRMKEEFDHCLNNINDPDVRVRALGVLRLLGELYMNFGVLSDDSKLKIFALAVLELMQKLIRADKSLPAVRCICQLLKLIGWEIGNAKDEKIQTYFNMVLNELKLVKTSTGINPSCVSLADMVLKLHSNKWNREEEGATSSTYSPPAPSYTNLPGLPAQPVYYELPESDDDFSDDGAIMIDDEPEEVQAAYEEFLKMNSKSKK